MAPSRTSGITGYLPGAGVSNVAISARLRRPVPAWAICADQPAAWRRSRASSTWLRLGLKNTPGACSSLLKGKTIMSIATSARCNEQHRVGRQLVPVEYHQAEEERLERDDVGVREVLHGEPARDDGREQREHQVIGGTADVAHAVDQKAPRPEPRETGQHGESGVQAERLDERHPGPDRLGEIAQVAQEHREQRDMEDPAEEPDPLVGAEQALKSVTSTSMRSATPRRVVGAGGIGIFSGCGVRAYTQHLRATPPTSMAAAT